MTVPEIILAATVIVAVVVSIAIRPSDEAVDRAPPPPPPAKANLFFSLTNHAFDGSWEGPW